MESGTTALERAFQLARSGDYGTVSKIRSRLRFEGYSDGQVIGPTLVRQLSALINEARGDMPKGPKGEKRPADVVGNAVKDMKIVLDEDTDQLNDDGKDKAAQSLGQRGGKARALALSASKRKQIAQAAAKARWKK